MRDALALLGRLVAALLVGLAIVVGLAIASAALFLTLEGAL